MHKKYYVFELHDLYKALLGGSAVKYLPANAESRWGSSPGGRNGNPFSYSCLESSMDREAWYGTVHRVAKSWTWLSDSVQFSSVAQSCLTLCDPMNCSTPGLPFPHQLPEFTQTHVHWVGDAIQPSHPLSSPSPPAPNPSQHESFPMSQLFTWGGQSIGVSALASVLPKKSQDWSPSEWTGWISVQSKGLSRVFSNTTVQKHQFFGTQLSSQSNFHIHTWPLEKPYSWLDGPLLAK